MINNRDTAQHMRNGGIEVPPGSTCEEVFEVLEGQVWYVWLMTVDRALNGQNGGQGSTGGHWFPSNPLAGIPAASTLIPTAAIVPTAVSQIYAAPAGFAGATTGVTVLAARVAPTAPPTGYFDLEGRATIEIPANCTLIHEIRQGTVTGPVHGQQVVPNTLSSQVTYPFVVLGRASSPVWGGLYGTVANVINTSGFNVGFIVVSSSFELVHVKV